jgi:hypothetical protein
VLGEGQAQAALGPTADRNVVFGRRRRCAERTSDAERVAYLFVGAACWHQPQRSKSLRDLRRGLNPKVHIDCSENADVSTLKDPRYLVWSGRLSVIPVHLWQHFRSSGMNGATKADCQFALSDEMLSVMLSDGAEFKSVLQDEDSDPTPGPGLWASDSADAALDLDDDL